MTLGQLVCNLEGKGATCIHAESTGDWAGCTWYLLASTSSKYAIIGQNYGTCAHCDDCLSAYDAALQAVEYDHDRLPPSEVIYKDIIKDLLGVVVWRTPQELAGQFHMIFGVDTDDRLCQDNIGAALASHSGVSL